MADKELLAHPNKVTLKWLWENVGYKFWLSLLSLFVATFIAGMNFPGSKIYNSLFDSSDSLASNTEYSNQESSSVTNENPYNAKNSSNSFYQRLNNKHAYI